jgi:ribonucleotide reductase alpha subunit
MEITKTKRIKMSDVKVGMKIKTMTPSGEITFREVTDKFNTPVLPEQQVRLEFENGTVINCSTNHPILVKSEEGQIRVDPMDLTADDEIITDFGLTKLKFRDLGQSNDSAYLDITVDDTHVFFTSESIDGPMVLTKNSQGGLRNASCTAYFPLWHYEFDNLIVLKNNQGTEETRVRHLDYGVVLSAFFWRRFRNKENITFFDPNEVPDMYEAFYSDTKLFEKLYVQNEKRKDLRKKVISAEEVFKGGLLKERTDTGRIYLMYTDNVQNQGPFDPKLQTIYQSNLCCVVGDAKVNFMHKDGNVEEMSLESAVERFQLGALTGSKIKSYRDDKESWESVSAAIKTKTVTELYEIEDETGNILRCTGDHLIYTKNRGYVRADELIETDLLLTDNKTSMSSIRKIKVEPTDVYDISVPETKCFFANNILVHNCEVVLPNKPFKRLDDDFGRISLCTLGSINWGSFRNPEDMRRACRILLRSLNNILDYQDFLSIQSKLSNEEIRPIGIGVTNLAYWHAKRGLKYGEPDALAEVKSFMEHQAYYLTEATVELAKERGACKESSITRYGQGIFPWELRAKGVNELTDFTPELDWETLRIEMKKYGVRNATVSAIAPVESSSVVINSTNGIEMPMSLISTKESKAGSFTQVVPEYHRLKNKYQLMWDQTDCLGYLKTAAVLQAYIDQSISTNTFYSPAHFPDRKVPATLIAKNLMLGHYYGLKTFYYSLISKQGSRTLDGELQPLSPIDFDDNDENCSACKL